MPIRLCATTNHRLAAFIFISAMVIGYVEYGYAKQNKLNFASLENKAQQFVAATPESAAKTLASVTLPENLRTFISDPEGADSYPIVTYTWILLLQSVFMATNFVQTPLAMKSRSETDRNIDRSFIWLTRIFALAIAATLLSHIPHPPVSQSVIMANATLRYRFFEYL
jgi:hypothetical protein